MYRPDVGGSGVRVDEAPHTTPPPPPPPHIGKGFVSSAAVFLTLSQLALSAVVNSKKSS